MLLGAQVEGCPQGAFRLHGEEVMRENATGILVCADLLSDGGGRAT